MHNPLRSEAEMFRLVVIIGVAAVPVIALGLIAGPEWGLVVLGVELGIGIALIWRGSKGTLPHEAEVAHDDDGVHRILVVANQTVTGRSLLNEIKAHHASRETEILVVVPALPHTRLEHLAHDV